MKKTLNYGTITFTPGAFGVGTIVFSGYYSFEYRRVIQITNITRKVSLYAAEIDGNSGAWSSTGITGGTLTLDADTTGYNAADQLRVIYDEPDEITVGAAASSATVNTDLITGIASAVTGYFDAAGYDSMSFVLSTSAGIATGAIQWEQTNDPALGWRTLWWDVCDAQQKIAQNAAQTLGASSLGVGRATLHCRYVRCRVTTNVTGGTVQVVCRFFRNSAMPGGQFETIVQRIGGLVMTGGRGNGGGNYGLSTCVVNAVGNTDYNAQDWKAASGNGATITAVEGMTGASASFDVNVTAFSAGSSSGLTVYLQESPDNSTAWYDIWQTEEITAAGRVRIPAIPIGGRRRMRWVNRGGAATTCTVTVTSQNHGVSAVQQRQFFDRTIALITGSSTTASFIMDGCTTISMYLCVTGGTPSTAPIITLQTSMDGTNWANTTTTLTPTAAGTFVATTQGSAKFVRAIVSTASSGGTPYTLVYVGFHGTN